MCGVLDVLGLVYGPCFVGTATKGGTYTSVTAEMGGTVRDMERKR